MFRRSDEPALIHAIDLALAGDYDGAKAAIEPLHGDLPGHFFLLVCEAEQREVGHKRALSVSRHEIGNALSIAQANVEGIIDGVLDDTATRMLGIRDALTTAGALLDNLTNSPRGDGPSDVRIETFNVCAVIDAQAALIAGLAAKKNVRLVYEPCDKTHGDCAAFRGDPERVGQILRNILLNAVRYTPPGGLVELECDRPAGELTVGVTDTGPGISKHDAEHIFESGYRGEQGANGAPGSGIGLSVVSGLLRALGGEVRVVSEHATGATFTVKLPAAP